MNFKSLRFFFIFFCLFFISENKIAFSEIVKDIQVLGNDRISKETIIMFSEIAIDEDIDSTKINRILKNLYKTNFLKMY